MVTGCQRLIAVRRSMGSHWMGKKSERSREWHQQGGHIDSLTLFMHYNFEKLWEMFSMEIRG